MRAESPEDDRSGIPELGKGLLAGGMFSQADSNQHVDDSTLPIEEDRNGTDSLRVQL
jgi:hypothetical protein